MMMVTTVLLVFHLLWIRECHGVIFRAFIVPQEVRAGDNITLECQVDTWPSPLYSLAWWKDGSQFYRVAVTKSYHQVDVVLHPLSSSSLNFAKLYAVPGLKAKAGRRLGEVILQEVEAATSGTYTCEAVADFPTFSQNVITSNLTVVEPPATKPIISGFKGRYYPGEVLTPNCTVLRCHPLPSITWFANGKKLKGDVIEVKSNSDMTFTLIDRLALRIHKHHFRKGIFNLTCGALVGKSLWSSTSITARHAHPMTRQQNIRHSKMLHEYKMRPEGDGGHVNMIGEGSRPYQRLHSGGSSTYSTLSKGHEWMTLIALVAVKGHVSSGITYCI